MDEVKKLRPGIREHRDNTRHELYWHHPALWGLLPEKTDPVPEVLRVAMSLVDRVVVLDHGALIASGPPERMRHDPRVVKAYLGEDARAQDL